MACIAQQRSLSLLVSYDDNISMMTSYFYSGSECHFFDCIKLCETFKRVNLENDC